MTLTNELRERINECQYKEDLSLSQIHRDILKAGGEITYATLSAFVNGHSESTGEKLNMIDEFLKSKGY